MPETEIPPVLRGDFYLSKKLKVSEILYSVERCIVCIVEVSCKVKGGTALEDNIVSLYFKRDIVKAVFTAVKMAVIEYVGYKLPVIKILRFHKGKKRAVAYLVYQ